MLDGHKSFASGVTLAQRFLLLAVEDSVHHWAMVPADRAGLVAEDSSWDHLGQRLTATGTLTLSGVEVAHDEFLTPSAGANPVLTTLVTPLMQAVFANVYLGAARGALEDAAGYVRTHTRPWVHSGAARAQEEPYAIERFGEFYTDLLDSEALADRANADLEALLDTPEQELTAEHRGRVAVEVYALKVHATRTSLDITSRVFEVMGARAAALALGHDRRWRDIRTHTLHDPAVWKTHDVGV
ncbi:hypothetical protein [Nocardioides houyundeii]|uniref:hypothetical protein n=1 Tax=Nocardioides houyundeii TaxID=2045452 RepID=UPI000DF2179A|nr:hypothetical protein [Nocardioides houyundeii]